MSDPAIRRASDLRLDLYIPPRLEIQRPEDNQQRVTGKFVEWRFRDAPGNRKTVLRRALRYWHHGKLRHLVVSDDPGQGKTVLSLRIQKLLSDPQAKKQIYKDGRARLVVHWMSRLPQSGKDDPQCIDLLMADESLQAIYDDSVLRKKVIEYAISHDRLVIILDAFDELPAKQKRLLYRVFATSSDQVRWIITGRDWAINRAIADNKIYDPKQFFRLRIKAFSKKLQDQFMRRALPDVRWRDALKGSHEEWNELLGLPSTLREIMRAFVSAPVESKSLRFSSPSDLFCFSSRQMLSRELQKDAHVEAIGEEGLNIAPAKAARIIERAVGAIALEMALRNHWREVIKDNTTDLNTEIDRIWEKAKNRFLQGFPTATKRWRQRAWEWAKNFLNHFEFHRGSAQADLTAESLVFRNVRIQEMNLGRYLTDFATEADLRGSKKEGSIAREPRCVLKYLGDPKWDNSWRCAIRMPVRNGSEKEYGVDRKVYTRALHILFERPMNRCFRRPTVLMWIADQWLESMRLTQLQKTLRQHLGKQFVTYHEAATTKNIAECIIDLNNYVILADSLNPSRVEAKIEDAVPSFKAGRFKMGKESPIDIELTKYAIGKFAITNQQFQLFDDIFAEESNLQRERFGKPDQPACLLSWFDGFWFTEFVEYGRQAIIDANQPMGEPMGDWRVVMPTDVQFEYAYRAGCQGTYFYVWTEYEGVNSLVEVNSHRVPRYAYCGMYGLAYTTEAVGNMLPNAFGLRLAGNIYKWVFDGAGPPLGGCNPVTLPRDWGRILRSCSWYSSVELCESSHRTVSDAWSRRLDYGLVLALSPVGATSMPQTS